MVLVLTVMFCLSKYKERKSRDDVYTKNQLGRSPQKLGEPKIKEVSDIKEPPVKLKNNAGKGCHCSLGKQMTSSFFTLFFAH